MGCRKILILALVLLAFIVTACSRQEGNFNESPQEMKTVVDAAGRTVTVPATINTVYSVSPIGTIFMYTLAPDKIIGLNWEAPDSEKKYTLASYYNLPVLGGSFGKDKIMNKEVVLKAKPDIILQMGEVDATTVSTADSLAQQLNIPVVVVGLNLMNMAETYEFMGNLLGVEERGKELADYCQQTLAEVQTKVATIPPDKQVRLYYAEGNEGLETDPKGSSHTEVIDVVRGMNVADVGVQNGYGRAQVSIEQIFNWNPEMILVCHDLGFQVAQNPYQFIQNDEKWGRVQAVQNKKVYKIPNAPFNWLDRPPSVNRIIGIKWLAKLLYPDSFLYDMKQETKKFYKLFYQVELTDQDVEDILQYAK